MKKSAIQEGVTYRNKSGSSARRVISIAGSRVVANCGVDYRAYSDDDFYVVYMQERGAYAGKTSASTLTSFAAWANSEDAGAPENIAALREKVATLRAELECAWTLVEAAADETASALIRHHADRIKGVLLSAGSDPSIFA